MTEVPPRESAATELPLPMESARQEAIPRPLRFKRWVTVIMMVLLVPALLGVLIELRTVPGVTILDAPVELAITFHEAGLDLDSAVGSSRWEKALHWVLWSPGTEELPQAIVAYSEILSLAEGELQIPQEHLNLLRVRLIVLLLEAGRTSDASAEVEKLSTGNAESEMVAETLRGLLAPKRLEKPDPLEPLLDTLDLWGDGDPILASGWAIDSLIEDHALLAGDRERATLARERILERGRRLWHRLLATGLLLLVPVLGLILGFGFLWRRRPLPRTGDGIQVAPWSSATAFAVTVRSLFWGVALGLGLFAIADSVFENLSLVTGFEMLIASIPMVLYLRKLTRSAGITIGSAFSLRSSHLKSLFVVVLVLIGIEQLLHNFWFLAGEVSGFGLSWDDGISEGIVRGSVITVILESLDAVLWAPIFEEIAFRGLIYTALRRRFSPFVSAVASAAAFAALHPYGVAGLLALFTSAVASALVYERTRSLIPCIASHAFTNFLVLTSHLVLR